ncbi:potassium-transporting ATPase subunit C [Amycolatopsis alkalitolerans]|uniref:Potassium-transporting ATPase KdpC subunit n=1 Tax=Amycolatopsis alkalitolerans TaxID=2547244 RepID=A0A5C4LWR2_9PSEU|nr:potassium-transporting ATPase subunit C [Amycolatopsis alkalitolerans]TNC22461.1 potassium-transporting ATPase subunit C [Amycolatopsis alkalitolerans]
MLKQTMAGLRVLLVFTVLLGVLYPLGIWVVSRIPGLQSNAEGSVVTVHGQAVGSSLIGIDPVAPDPAHDPYFHTRPSASGDPASTGGSNLGGFSEKLLAQVQERKDAIAKREGVSPDAVPADAVTASASGVDPDISVAYADLQIARVARNTGVPEATVKQLVQDNTTGDGIGIPGVNVLKLNLAVAAAKAH